MSGDASTKRAATKPNSRRRKADRPRSSASKARAAQDALRLASDTSGRPDEGRPDIGGDGGTREKVSIDLTPAQINQVIRISAEGNSVPSLLAGLGDLRQTLAEKALPARPAEWHQPSFSRSLFLGLLVLASLPSDGSYVRSVDIARKVELPGSTTYRYLSTLVLAGLVERDAASRRYRRPAL